MNKQGRPSAPPGPAQMRFLVESQDKKIEELKNMMMRFTHDTKNSLEYLTQSQKGNEVGFRHVGAKLRQIEGGVDQLTSKTQEIESAMEAWTEEDGLDSCVEGDDDGNWSGGMKRQTEMTKVRPTALPTVKSRRKQELIIDKTLKGHGMKVNKKMKKDKVMAHL